MCFSPPGVPDASKVAWRNIPSGEGLDSNEDKDSDLARQEEAGLVGGDSDMESGGDSDIENLQSAGIWSDVETVKMHLAHLSKLKVSDTCKEIFDYRTVEIVSANFFSSIL